MSDSNPREKSRVPIQVGTEFSGVGRYNATVPEPIARMAYAEYERQGHGSQSFERLHQRGGFGVVELMTLLCQRIAFIEARTTKGVTYQQAKAIGRAWPKLPPAATCTIHQPNQQQQGEQHGHQ